jgi:hypothetical protein
MPYPAEHMLLQWHGLHTNGGSSPVIDHFYGTLRFIGPGVAAADNQEVCDAMWAAMSTWWGATGNYIPSFARLAAVKWNRIGTSGHYVSKTRTLLSSNTNMVGGSAPSRYPLQVSWVASYRTSIERGLASKGRNYFPTSVEVGASNQMRVADNDCQTMATRVAALLVSLNAAASTGGETLVAGIATDTREGAQSPITAVSVGNRLDIQRSRDNAQEEQYFSANLGPA